MRLFLCNIAILVRVCFIDIAVVTTWAGSGALGFGDGVGQQVAFNLPDGLAVDASGTVWVADTNNHRIRKISPGGMRRLRLVDSEK